MSTAELPRPSTPPEAYPTYGVRARACLSIWRGSFPKRYGATDSWIYASTASAPKKVSPRPVTPSSVCTRTQRRFGNSPSRNVSTALTFTCCLRCFPSYPDNPSSPALLGRPSSPTLLPSERGEGSRDREPVAPSPGSMGEGVG